MFGRRFALGFEKYIRSYWSLVIRKKTNPSLAPFYELIETVGNKKVFSRTTREKKNLV